MFPLGTAEIENVEFKNMGQRGYTESDDPRFSLAFVSTDDADAEHPAYVLSCSFHQGWSTHIGVFDATGVVMSNNVIIDSWESGMVSVV